MFFFKMFVIALVIPIIVIGLLKGYYIVIPGEEIGKVGDWISFSGGYIGALLGLLGIWSQIEKEKKEKELEKKEKNIGFFKYLVFTIENNINNLEDDYIFYKNTSFKNEFNEDSYNENLFPKNIIEDYFNTLFKYEWSSLFFYVNENINKFNGIFMHIKTNSKINKKFFEDFKKDLKIDAEKEDEIEKNGGYTSTYSRDLVDNLDVVDDIYNCICHIELNNKTDKLDEIFAKIIYLDINFEQNYSLFKEKMFNQEYSRTNLYRSEDINFIRKELYLMSLYIIKITLNDSFNDYKYFKKFTELEKFINLQIKCIRILVYLKDNLQRLKENIESEYK